MGTTGTPTMPPSSGSGAPPGMPNFPLPPSFPPGVDPQTYKIAEVTKLLKSAAYFPIFNVPNPNTPNDPILLFPWLDLLLIGVNVNEQLHRFDVRVSQHGHALKATNEVGDPVANVQIRWTPTPDDFQAAPDRFPQPTILNPFVSQRFCMLNGQLNFIQPAGTGIRAFGTGRTFPSRENGQLVLRIGAVIEILEGLGAFKGLTGAMVINGIIQPPHNLALSLVARLMDPQGTLRASAEPPAIATPQNPDPNAVFMYFLGEPDPSSPVTLNLAPDGTILGSQVSELLRLVHISFQANQSEVRSRTDEGPIVGSVTAKLSFNPLAPLPVQPIQTTNGVFTFWDRHKNPIGTVNANMVEGRAMQTPLVGAPMPVFRLAGFGPLLGGTGEFQNAEGMMSLNAAISVFPRTLSNLYIFRFYDPSGNLRRVAAQGWSS
jgi:hypothetical protein